MRSMTRMPTFVICVLLSTLPGACGHGTYTQTYVSSDDPTKSLTLSSGAGFVRPGANFPASVVFKLFGTEELEGTYVLMNGDQKIAGKFTAGKDGDTQWIRFSSTDRPDWKLKVFGGRLIESDSDTTWALQTASAVRKEMLSVQFGK